MAPSEPLLSPASQWTGVLDSGYGTANPAKPAAIVRVNARPTLRPLFLDHHFVTGANDGSEVLVFAADAIDDGNPATDIAYVRVWLEGRYIDVTQRSRTVYTDLLGVQCELIGYKVRVDYAAAQAIAVNGMARVCAEAFCTDGTWTKQVSPERTIHFRPGAGRVAGQRYDVVKTVAASGADYTTLGAAMGYSSSNPTQYVGIKILQSGNWRPSASVALAVASRPVEIFAAAGVTAQMGLYNTTAGSGNAHTGRDGVRFMGPGITLDTSTSANQTWAIAVGNGSDDLLQFDGVEIYTGNGGGTAGYNGSGAALTFNGLLPNQYWIGNYTSARLSFKDCDMHDLAGYATVSAEAVINCRISDVSGSALENVRGVIHGCTLTRIGGKPTGLVDHVDAMLISYAGAGTASITKTTVSNGGIGAGNGVNGYYNLFVDGVFQTSFSTATYTTWAALAAAITTYGNNFSATANVGSRLSTVYGSRAGQVPSYIMYPAVNFSAGAMQLTEIADIHANCIVNHTMAVDNLNVGFTELLDIIGSAPISQDGSVSLTDVTYRNVFVQDTSDANGVTAQRGYLTPGTGSNVQFRCISVVGVGAGAYLASAGAGAYDAYCGHLDSYYRYIFWSNTPDPDYGWRGLVIQNNALPSGASAANDSKTLGGAAESTFINSATGVPVLDGALKLASGRYAGAKAPATGAFGNWNV